MNYNRQETPLLNKCSEIVKFTVKSYSSIQEHHNNSSYMVTVNKICLKKETTSPITFLKDYFYFSHRQSS